MNRDARASRFANTNRGPRGTGWLDRPEIVLLAAASCALLIGIGRRAARGVSTFQAGGFGRTEHLSNRPEATPRNLEDAAREAQPMQKASGAFDEVFERLSPGQPLALGALGLAAGAALAAILPGTSLENAAFGEARERVAEAATQAAHEQLARLRGAREAATEKLREEAAERRLTPEGLKDLAHELAQAAKDGASHSSDEAHGADGETAATETEAG